MRSKRPCLLLAAGLVVAFYVIYQYREPSSPTETQHHRHRPPRHNANTDLEHDTAVHKVATIFTILRDLPLSSKATLSAALEAYNHVLQHDRPGALAVPAWFALPVDVVAYGSKATCAYWRMATAALVRYPRQFKCVEHPCLKDGIPRLDCAFATTKQLAQTKLLMYSNADIVYFEDLIDAINYVDNSLSKSDFLLVGRRRDLPLAKAVGPAPVMERLRNAQQAAAKRMIDVPWAHIYLNSWQAQLKHSTAHNRNGIDYFIFPQKVQWQLPAYLVGRIEWDQWLLLRAMCMPTVYTVEMSEVVNVLHLGKATQASHAQNGTEYNKQLTLQHMPRRYHKSPATVHVPNAVWIGRLDETDLLLRPQPTQPGTGLDVKVRSSAAYFGKDVRLPPAKRSCPSCQLVYNAPSFEKLLYLQHTLVGNRRAVTLVMIRQLREVPEAYDWHCRFSQRGEANHIFVTTDAKTWKIMLDLQLPVLLFNSKAQSSDPAVSFACSAVEVMLKALYHGYCATLVRLTVRLTASLEDFFDHAFGLNALPAMGEAPRHDVITVSSKAQQLQVLWLRSRRSTYTLGTKLLTDLMDIRTTGSPWQLIKELLGVVLQQSAATSLSIKHLTLGSHSCKQSHNEPLLTKLDTLFSQLKASPLPQFAQGLNAERNAFCNATVTDDDGYMLCDGSLEA
eukprot:m.168309 g.168309  ORF g.168309 m.168309 type:complete len:676 (+) comp16649_c0_seq5:180-2207(+)